ncbi:MAG TPA: methyltransferase [Isosphaeraceae bacterium]|jgi:predicted nicotinamide N-methyase|nr:methyltransferase [Isosphaeraceae bacterium]
MIDNRKDHTVQTHYQGPQRLMDIAVAGRTIRLVRPVEPDRLLDEPGVAELNARDDYMPYWAYLWPGAIMLAEAVLRTPWPPGTEALEIGCGLGLAGLAGVMAGLRVTLSDYDQAPLAFVAQSAEANGFGPDSYSLRTLDWRDLPHQTYPLILGSDVLYERRLVPLVVNLIDRMLAPDGIAMLAGPYRVATEDLEPALRARGLRFETEVTSGVDDGGERVRGTLHRITRQS